MHPLKFRIATNSSKNSRGLKADLLLGEGKMKITITVLCSLNLLDRSHVVLCLVKRISRGFRWREYRKITL